MKPANTVIIMSDEHNRDILGCYGDDIAITPNLDRLAKQGIKYSNAYTNSPVCVPARASFASGRYPHQIGAWDSVSPFDGSTKGWGSRLRDAGHHVASIGKLHFRSAEDDNGFSEEIAPMHVYKGVGWLSSLLRNPPNPIQSPDRLSTEIGPGETDYTKYDRSITSLACEWLRNAGLRKDDKPWVLYVGLVAPHFPLIAPPEFFDLYEGADIPAPRQYAENDRPRHPVLDALRKSSNYDDSFDTEKVRIARQSYYGLCSFLDDNIGQIMNAIELNGLSENTRVIYTSDHGDNLGHRGLWGKSVMYDDAAAVPLLMSGADLPHGLTVDTPVSLVDIHPTLMAFAGESALPDDTDLPGQALSARLETPDDDRAVFSEYHDWSAITGMFMLRTLDWKIVCYPGYPDQLFDMSKDPHEINDLANDIAFQEVLRDMKAKLTDIVDMEALNKRVFDEQALKIAANGGPEGILKKENLAYTPPP